MHSVIRVAIVTMGCAKNEVDSAAMADRLRQAGYCLCAEAESADAIIINTCAFIQPATEESLQAIFEANDLAQVVAGDAKVIVAGCMPARYGKDLEESLVEVQTFVPCSEEQQIVTILDKLFPSRLVATPIEQDTARLHSAYVKISDGCDRFCSYCTIPYIRGRYHSFSEEQIEADVCTAIEKGAKEIVLIAQDTGRWGDDFPEPRTLAALMRNLATRHPATWFRIMYLEPDGITDELLQTMAKHSNICPYLDIPLQHCEAHILQAMNRYGSGGQYRSLINHIRALIPNVTLRTTLIAGFPGETEDDFEALCSFVQDIDFDYVGVFPYSQEEGTRAATLPDQLDQDTKEERSRRLRDIADAISANRIAKRIGHDMDILVLGAEEDDQLYGRGMCQAPDVDGVTYLDRGEIGTVQHARITDTLLYDMEGEVL